jgi:hypothetical protein
VKTSKDSSRYAFLPRWREGLIVVVGDDMGLSLLILIEQVRDLQIEEFE